MILMWILGPLFLRCEGGFQALMQTSLYHSAMCARKTVSDILHLGVFRPICHSECLMHLLLR